MKISEAFPFLNAINTNDHVEKKNGLSYLSWAWAWGILKTHFPASSYTIYETPDGKNYFSDGKTAWVKTGVTLVADDGSLEHVEYLPIMNMRNQSIPLANITSFDVNKSIQRSLTKAVARHGLGLYIYAGEDLPDDDDGGNAAPSTVIGKKTLPAKKPAAQPLSGKMQQVDAAIKAVIGPLDTDRRKPYIEKIKAIAGQVNYQVITDEAVLDKLLEAFQPQAA